MANRLADATSPYLLQHADNPVDWWPWSPEAFERARQRDVPVLLSIGYAACHWCHVMAHESFEDAEIAAVMNENFVNIKVDREERPDVDAVYMEATQAMTGQGGWPMTSFVTPDGEPFHCGTYYPAAPMHGMPSFRQLLDAVARAWAERGDEVRQAASSVVEQLEQQRSTLPESTMDNPVLADAVSSLHGEFDADNGGFGNAPKFPPSMVLEFFLRHHERVGDEDNGHDALTMAREIADAMARGGIYDQLAGGFARYSVDAHWTVPHFEKMLYDNALLLRAYAHLARLDPTGIAPRITRETADFLLRDLRTTEGGFAASLDADTNGVEGLTYVWTPDELRQTLGDTDGEWAAELLGVTTSGTFEHGASTLRLPRDPDDPARWQRIRETLHEARGHRPQPNTDDKVVTAWNGCALTALAEASTALDEPRWLEAAEHTADLLLRLHRTRENGAVDGKTAGGEAAAVDAEGPGQEQPASDSATAGATDSSDEEGAAQKQRARLHRNSRHGTVGRADGVLEDYGCLAEGLLSLHQATGARRWLDAACELLDTAHEKFSDPDNPGNYFDTAHDAEELVRRPSDPTDNASPSGASAVTSALLTASALAGADRAPTYRRAAERALSRAGLIARRAPRFAGHWMAAAEALAHGPLQIAIAGEAGGDRAAAGLERAARRHSPGGAVAVAGEPEATGVPLLSGRTLIGGAPAAYVCRGYVCDRPVTSIDDLIASMRGALRSST